MGGWVHEIDEPGIVSNDSADPQSIELGIDEGFEVVEDQIFIYFAEFFERSAVKEQGMPSKAGSQTGNGRWRASERAGDLAVG
jgi:hypothetical protein